MRALLRRGTSILSPSRKGEDNSSATQPHSKLFPTVDPAVDGQDCDRDCASCTIHYPARFDVEESDKLYGQVKGWSTHLLVATGKSDWVRDVADEKGSLMEAIVKRGIEPTNGTLKLSASNMPIPEEYRQQKIGSQPTTVLLLPAFTIVEHVTPALAADLIKYFVNPAVTTTTPLPSIPTVPTANPDILSLTPLRARPCPHAAVILLCSQRTRDARCGLSAPLLRREFERHLRIHGLYRDMNDERPGGVGIYFISHVGGHKYSANVMVYRRRDFDWYKPKGSGAEEKPGEEVEEITDQEAEGATQGIWLARVRPEDCEGIVKFTILQGKVVKPQSQLRGGFNREKSLVSW
ncbi:Sucrase/ferredoxin-like domain containing protein [Elaphomyces granulatus]|jgi:hypothetical protein